MSKIPNNGGHVTAIEWGVAAALVALAIVLALGHFA